MRLLHPHPCQPIKNFRTFHEGVYPVFPQDWIEQCQQDSLALGQGVFYIGTIIVFLLIAMKDIFQQVLAWEKQGRRFAVATVIDTWRSSPRSVGSSMIIDAEMKVVGSVSGGCIEGAVIKTAQDVIKNGTAARQKFGISNAEAWSVGLSCGGAIEVYIYPFFHQVAGSLDSTIWAKLKESVLADLPCLVATQITPEAQHMWLGRGEEPIGDASDFPSSAKLEKILSTGRSQIIHDQGKDTFVHVFPPTDHLVIIGAAHLSIPLVQMAQIQGFKVTVIDPRGVFSESLASICPPDQLLTAWPADILPTMTLDQSVFTVTLTHDPKIDDQALHILMNSDVCYIGALGSTRTHAKRKDRLKEAGFSADRIDKIYGPVGLNIAAESPDEIALSILAQIVQIKNERILVH